MSEQRLRLNVLALALAGGILWGGCMLFVGIAAQYTSWCDQLRELIGSLYLGSASGVAGIFIGAAWGFAVAFVGCLIFAWLYNCFVGKPKAEAP